MTQAFGKLPVAFNWTGVDMALVSAHKLGGPKGVGALVVRRGLDVAAQLRGGGQEMGRRAGTENVIGIAGFGAAAEAAADDLAAGVWDRVEKLRNILESTIAEISKETIFVGQEAPACRTPHAWSRRAGKVRHRYGARSCRGSPSRRAAPVRAARSGQAASCRRWATARALPHRRSACRSGRRRRRATSCALPRLGQGC